MHKSVVVTGGSRGIGAEIARAFAIKGYTVALLYNKNKASAMEVLNTVKEYSPYSYAYKCDVSDTKVVNECLMEISQAFGGVDILINNAGISITGLLTDLSEENWDRIFNVNVKGVFNCTKALLPSMISRHYGRIINISSMWGQVGASCEVAYSATKSAIIGFTKALAKEVSPSGINVNCVCPGVIMTDMMSEYNEEDIENLKYDTPVMRLGTPSDIAKAVLFLASEDADFITGQIIGVNGGFVI